MTYEWGQPQGLDHWLSLGFLVLSCGAKHSFFESAEALSSCHPFIF
jgi:hypothetical protein